MSFAMLGKSTSTCIDGTCSNGSDESSGSTVFISHEEVRREKAEVQESAEKVAGKRCQHAQE